jgi:DNA-binding CsgD family transcriptional regulator
MVELIENAKKIEDLSNQCNNKHSLPLSLVQIEEKILLKTPSYFFTLEDFESKISNISSSLKDIHGLNPKDCDYSDIVDRIHPEDFSHYILSSQIRTAFFSNEIKTININQFNQSIFFRIRVKTGDFKIINQQSIVIEIKQNGQIQKSLIIHTVLENIYPSKKNILKLVFQQEKPKVYPLVLSKSQKSTFEISKRELEIIQLIYAGFENLEISKKLFISLNTVKKHRSNILKKSSCNNTAQLLNKCISEGII